jgi:hypothetical protein
MLFDPADALQAARASSSSPPPAATGFMPTARNPAAVICAAAHT